MADQTPAERKMYQPTPEEIANLYSRMNETIKAAYYERAREILADVNRNFVFDLRDGWSIRSQSEPLLHYGIDTRYEPPLCHCASFWSDPATTPNPPHIYLNKPNGGKLLRRQCKHTLAYMGYRTILAQHFERCQSIIPPHIKRAMYNGILQPADALALNRFAYWLPIYISKPAAVSLISRQLLHPYDRPN